MFIEQQRNEMCTRVKMKMTMKERLKLLFSDGMQITLMNNSADPKIKVTRYHTEIEVFKKKK